MQHNTINGYQKPISRLVLGSIALSTDTIEESCQLIDAYVAAGGNCIDTAHVYNGGKSERAIGEWFRRNSREQIVLIDKGAHPYWTEPRVDPTNISQDIAESLERLGTDYIDLYLLHRDNPKYPVAPIVDCLNEHIEAGHIRAFGGSNWTTARLEEANVFAQAYGLAGMVASSPHLGLAKVNQMMWAGCLAMESDDIGWHTKTQFPVFPWSAQSSGFFTGRYTSGADSPEHIVKTYFNEGNWERLRRATQLGAKHNATAHQIALAWVLCQPFPIFPLIGPRFVTELQDSLPALAINLTKEDIKWLNLEEF